MSMNYDKPTDMNGSVTDSQLISSTPIWETRGKKRRGLNRFVAPKPTEEASEK